MTDDSDDDDGTSSKQQQQQQQQQQEQQLPFSQVPGRPSFLGSAVNGIAVVPLLSTDKHGQEVDSASSKSFRSFLRLVSRAQYASHSPQQDRNSETTGTTGGGLHNVDIHSTSHSSSKQTRETQEAQDNTPVVLVVPNSQLTRPGDWRYDSTPLKNFHWGDQGCQRLLLFDGRPHVSRMAHDKVWNPHLHDWIDLLPSSRRTAAVIGILNVQDLQQSPSLSQQESPQELLKRAQQELHQWAQRYSVPPHEVKAHGRNFARDELVTRLFVFDSFKQSWNELHDHSQTLFSNLDKQQQQDDSSATSSHAVVAFPPSDADVDITEKHDNDEDDIVVEDIVDSTTETNNSTSHHQQQQQNDKMMDLHLTVVINDLVVAIFRQLEHKIIESDALCHREKSKGSALPDARVKTHSLLHVSTTTTSARSTTTTAAAASTSTTRTTKTTALVTADKDEPRSKGGSQLSVANIANVVSPTNSLSTSATAGQSSSSTAETSGTATTSGTSGSFKPSSSATNASAPSSSTNNPLKTMVASAGRAARQVPNVAHRAAAAAHHHHNRQLPTPQLLTPLDTIWDLTELNPRDAQAVKKRLIARREKHAADLALLAGSPMDAYERYSRAAEMLKASPDPLWYASALEGCAAAHVAMAEAGGYNVDAYLENNFQMPDEFMAIAKNGPVQESRKQTAKQTLPSVVFALCEEALDIYSRHSKLAPLQAELLLKLAAYVADSDEAHMRCRWGEGDVGCYAGDLSTDLPRWDRPSVSQLAFQELRGKDDQDLLACSTASRCRRFCELVHRAASTGALAPLTRADVAATCTRLCLKGVMPTQWKNRPKRERIPLLRKAAFFATVAAEAISQCSDMESTLQASGLWLTATQFYSPKSNANGMHDYGWATLRASSLYALTQQEEDKLTSEAASEMLLALLSRMAPAEVKLPKADLRASLKALDMALQFDDPSMTANSKHSNDGADDASVMTDTSTSLSSRYSSYSKTTKTLSFRSSFFPQQPASAASLLTVAQAKWAEDDPIPQVNLPLIRTDQKGGALLLNCVLPKISAQSCASAQRGCISRISELRRELPTISSSASESHDPHYAFSLSGSPDKGEPIVPPPLGIVSVEVVSSESHLLLERFNKAGAKPAKGGSMATFYNPYDKKKESEETQTTLVAEGEERELTIEFSNRLAVPLDVPSCQIEFENDNLDRINAPALSFAIPPKAKKFAVQFPFVVMTNPKDDMKSSTTEGDDGTLQPNIFKVEGVRVTCLSRSYYIPLTKPNETETRQVPDSASVYQRRAQYDRARHEEMGTPRLDVVPPQPKLCMHFAESGREIVNGMTVPVNLSDGEVSILPTFSVHNDSGPAGLGMLERLQIVGVGLPGVSDEILFDSDIQKTGDSSSNKKDERSDGMTPLEVKVLPDGLCLASVNDGILNYGKENVVRFQITASHDFGNHIGKSANVRLRFRYRGSSLEPSSEIWRKTEVHLQIVRLKGPRISSLSFCPDLCWGSAYTELSKAFLEQKAKYMACRKAWKLASEDAPPNDGGQDVGVDSAVVARVGLDSGVHVASNEVALVLSVANETESTIVLSNRKGMVGGFDVSPMPTVKIAAGVSARIPLVIPRLKRVNENDGIEMDVAATLVSQLGLQWESRSDDNVDSPGLQQDADRNLRNGRICIPPICLREIFKDNQSFASRICESPVLIILHVGRKASEQCLSMPPGSPVDTFVEVTTADWVRDDVAAKCRITLEFCAARKEKPAERGAIVWCGLIRRTLRLNDAKKNHRARVVFLKGGVYVLSACATLTNDDGTGAEETWWAPLAETVVVETPDNVAQ